MGASNRLGSALGVGLAIAVLAWGLAPAGANQKRTARAQGPTSFTGSCQGSVTVGFTPPLTNTARPTTQRVRGAGTCSGTLVDGRRRAHKLTSAPFIYTASEQGSDVSCGLGIDAGSGSLRFQWGTLHFTVSERRAAALATLSFAGTKSGSATGVATAGGDAGTAVKQCAGSGIKHASASLTIRADSGISG